MLEDLFEDAGGYAGKVRCTTCGRTGYVDGKWQDSCRRGHPFACSCGRRFASLTARSAHRRHTGHEVKKKKEINDV